MKKITIVLTYLLFLLSPILLFPQCGTLIWSDEFNGTTLDASKWTPELGGGGWGNNELQTYTNSSNNLRVENGTLVMEARKEGTNSYTSSRIVTNGKLARKYGRYEMRAKMPAGTSLWPAFWLLPNGAGTWPTGGEIDIMENRGDQASEIGGTLHYGNTVPNNRYDGTSYILPTGNFNDNFHVFAVDWQAGRIEWSVDGVVYKIETASPVTLSPISNNATWPWNDFNFFIILNLAVGGVNTPYTGNLAPGPWLSGKYEIDYVRVYDAAQPQLTITGRGRVYENSIKNYSIPSGTGQTYNWTLPASVGATITAGQGTNQITVDWGTSKGGDLKVTITHGTGAVCPGQSFDYTKSVQVYANNCTTTLMNFDGITTMSTGYINGTLSEINNPGSNLVNNSARTARYVRNSSQQYDALFYENCLLDDGAQYASATPTYVLKMDLYTTAPIGTQVQIQLANAAAWGLYPAGIHSFYTAATTVTNQWETLTFVYNASPDGGGAAYQLNLDRVVFLFNPNGYTGHTYNFDNIRRVPTAIPPTLTITGAASVVTSATGIPYNVTGYNSTLHNFNWTVPSGASVASGAGTIATTVNYGLLGGFVTVQEEMTSGCYGPLAKLPISVGNNSCAIFADEFDDGKTAPWLTNSTGAGLGAGFTHAELISDWKLTSTGHDEWAYVEYTLNDGVNPITLDFTNPVNVPQLKFRARVATGMAYVTVTMVDYLGRVANNQYLNPLNGFDLTTTSTERTIDFTGQLWDQYGGGGALDISKIAKLRISYNPAYVSYPLKGSGNTYASNFIGTALMDYIRIGSDCPTPTANFTATDLVLCGTGAGYTTTYVDNSISVVGGTTYNWNFGAGAMPATATTAGPHVVSYSSAGWKSPTLTLNSTGSSRTKTNYVYASPISTGCMYLDHFGDNVVSPFAASQGTFTFAETASNWNVTIPPLGTGQWDTYTLAFNDGTAITPIDFTCANTAPTITIRAKATAAVSLRLGISDKTDVTTANATVTNKTLELTTAYQILTVNLAGLFTDAYSAGGPYTLDNTDTRKIQFRVNPGYASAAWTGLISGTPYSTNFVGTINIDYIALGANCASALPVEMVSFDVALVNAGVQLQWVTASEINLNHYEIERVENGKATTLGSVYAVGNTNALAAYSFADTQPLAGYNYYRIAAVDNDGTVQYSELLAIQTKEEALTVALAPNPSSVGFELSFQAAVSEETSVKVFSSEGVLVEEKTVECRSKAATIGENLKAGIYVVRVSTSKETTVLKAVKY